MSAATSPRVNRLRALSWTKWRVFLAVAVPLFMIYLATAMWGPGYGVDAFTHLQTAYNVAKEGSVYIEGDSRLPRPWMVDMSNGQSVSQYPPGAAALVVPFYTVWPGELTEMPRARHGGITPRSPGGERSQGTLLVPPLGPGAVLAALTTAFAIGLLAAVFFGTGGAGWAAIAGGMVAGLGTGAWSVASHYYWHHGPAMMWLAAGIFLASSREIWSGLAFGAAALTRPHTLVIAAATGISRGIGDRDWRPVVQIALGSSLGLVLLLAYNRAVFGAWTLVGGYGSGFAERAVSQDIGWYALNLLGALIHPQRGLLVYSPFILILVPGLVAAWRVAPAFVRGSAVGGLLYLLIQFKLHRFSEAGEVLGYRYPLEGLVAMAPLFYLSYREWVRGHRLAFWLFILTVALSIGFQFTALVADLV